MAAADPSAFHIQMRHDGGSVVVTVAGELDQETAPQLRARLQPFLNVPGSSVVLDLAELTFLDSTGLATFAGVYSRLREKGGGLSVVRASAPVSKALEITGLADILRHSPTGAEHCA